jgi:hypothetical protein
VRIHFKITEALLREIREDLRRPHNVAFERVGFIACAGGNARDGLMLLARSYHPVADDDYEAGEFVGAKISSRAVQRALALAYANSQAMLFVHEHGHSGEPVPSRVDLDCWKELVPNFWHVRPGLPHGALILSDDRAMGLVWVPNKDVFPIADFSVVGRRLVRWSAEEEHA